MAAYVNALIGCRLISNKHSSKPFSLRHRILSDEYMVKANRAITFNGRHFVLNFSLTKGIPNKVLALIEEKIRLTNLFIEDILDTQDQTAAILSPCGSILPLCKGQTNQIREQYDVVISWYHVRITLPPETIKKGLRSGWPVAGLILSKQIIKVACYRSRTNLRVIHHSIWFEYDLLNQQVCCNCGIKIEGEHPH